MTKAPERIWAKQSSGWGDLWRGVCQNRPADGAEEYTRTDLSNALIAAAYEAAAAEIRKLDNGKSDGEWLNYNLAVQRALGKIRALTPADARAALERVAQPRWYRMDDPENPPPKDGQEVVLVVDNRAGVRGRLVCHWQPGGHCIEDHPPISEGWYFWNGHQFDLAPNPTHWTPLLAPPEDEG